MQGWKRNETKKLTVCSGCCSGCCSENHFSHQSNRMPLWVAFFVCVGKKEAVVWTDAVPFLFNVLIELTITERSFRLFQTLNFSIVFHSHQHHFGTGTAKTVKQNRISERNYCALQWNVGMTWFIALDGGTATAAFLIFGSAFVISYHIRTDMQPSCLAFSLTGEGWPTSVRIAPISLFRWLWNGCSFWRNSKRPTVRMEERRSEKAKRRLVCISLPSICHDSR